MIFAHHELLIAVEYSVLAGGGVFVAIRHWWKTRGPK